ncbi:hypothetical protein VTK73DRAFT_5957 [Phialemonium thermophilum]|uniref:Glutaredoxin-like protein n=1 Tax=Phialemonium thermophilum TaxID=223376 RepID=A0ABR3WLI7_9PEZI
MQFTRRLLQSCRITLFTRENCGLCTQAKSVLSQVRTAHPFEFREVDIVKPEAKGWRDLYDFDVPVIHISRASAPEEDPRQASKAVKLMHRFKPEDVEAKMRLVETS